MPNSSLSRAGRPDRVLRALAAYPSIGAPGVRRKGPMRMHRPQVRRLPRWLAEAIPFACGVLPRAFVLPRLFSCRPACPWQASPPGRVAARSVSTAAAHSASVPLRAAARRVSRPALASQVALQPEAARGWPVVAPELPRGQREQLAAAGPAAAAERVAAAAASSVARERLSAAPIWAAPLVAAAVRTVVRVVPACRAARAVATPAAGARVAVAQAWVRWRVAAVYSLPAAVRAAPACRVAPAVATPAAAERFVAARVWVPSRAVAANSKRGAPQSADSAQCVVTARVRVRMRERVSTAAAAAAAARRIVRADRPWRVVPAFRFARACPADRALPFVPAWCRWPGAEVLLPAAISSPVR